MGSHIGCQETTAEAANKRQTTGSASGNRGRIYHQSSPRIKQKQGSPRFDQNEFHNSKWKQWENSRVEDNRSCFQLHLWDPNWASDVLPAGVAAPSPLLAALLPLPTAAGGHPEKATKPRGRGGRGLEEPRVESETSSFYVFIRVGTIWHYGFVIINKAFQNIARIANAVQCHN